MSWNYDTDLATNRDKVRFLVGDIDTSDQLVSDEEIDAVLTWETATGDALPYYAAARVLEHLNLRWLSAGRGVREKEVAKLRLKWGFDEKVVVGLEDAICELRKRGSWLLRPSGRSRFLTMV